MEYSEVETALRKEKFARDQIEKFWKAEKSRADKLEIENTRLKAEILKLRGKDEVGDKEETDNILHDDDRGACHQIHQLPEILAIIGGGLDIMKHMRLVSKTYRTGFDLGVSKICLPEGRPHGFKFKDRFPKLVSLEAVPTSFDFGDLEGMHELQSFDLSKTSIQDMGPLAAFRGLVSLDLHDCRAVKALDPLSNLAGLQFLNLLGVPEVESLTPLRGLRSLRRLVLGDLLSKIASLDGLEGLVKLEELTVAGTEVQSLGPLQGLISLRELALLGLARAGSFEPLASLVNLKELNLVGCPLLGSLQPLAGLSKLEALSLAGSVLVESLEPLSGLTKLASLDVRGLPQFANFQGFEGNPALAVLA